MQPETYEHFYHSLPSKILSDWQVVFGEELKDMGHADEKHNVVDAKQKAIDDWLPVTASREAKWYYSAFHNLTAMVGAGVLSLPYAMAHMGW